MVLIWDFQCDKTYNLIAQSSGNNCVDLLRRARPNEILSNASIDAEERYKLPTHLIDELVDICKTQIEVLTLFGNYAYGDWVFVFEEVSSDDMPIVVRNDTDGAEWEVAMRHIDSNCNYIRGLLKYGVFTFPIHEDENGVFVFNNEVFFDEGMDYFQTIVDTLNGIGRVDGYVGDEWKLVIKAKED